MVVPFPPCGPCTPAALKPVMLRRFWFACKNWRLAWLSMLTSTAARLKEINDTHGHQTGDKVLQTVAKLLRRKMREMDLVARYGGEEFAVILPGTNLDDASKAAMRACAAIEQCKFRHDEKELRVTVSFGVAEVLGNEDGAMLVARADKALYAAKEGGRNCAYRHDGETVDRVVGNDGRVVPESKGRQQNRPAPCEPKKAEEAGSPPDAGATEPKPDLARGAELDALSGLPCRTTFCQQVRNRTAEWKRGGPTFSLVLIEVDQHEQCGGHCGQRTRDSAMLAATRFLTATVREMDILGSYAPGCFALLLPTAGLADAIRVAERLREEFSQDQSFGARRAIAVYAERWRSTSHGKRRFDVRAKTGRSRLGCRRSARRQPGLLSRRRTLRPITAMLETMGYLA